LKTQLQETKRIEEVLSKRLNDKEKNYETLDTEIVLLRRKLEKGTTIQSLKVVQKSWMTSLIVKDHQVIRLDWVMITRKLIKDQNME